MFSRKAFSVEAYSTMAGNIATLNVRTNFQILTPIPMLKEVKPYSFQPFHSQAMRTSVASAAFSHDAPNTPEYTKVLGQLEQIAGDVSRLAAAQLILGRHSVSLPPDPLYITTFFKGFSCEQSDRAARMGGVFCSTGGRHQPCPCEQGGNTLKSVPQVTLKSLVGAVHRSDPRLDLQGLAVPAPL